MKIDQSKLAEQKKALQSWRSNNYQGTIEAATGFGKTYMGTLACREMYQTLSPDSKVTVVVPTDYLRNKWREEVETHNLKNVKVNTINSWIKEDTIDTDLIILDEIHGYTGGEKFSTIFERTNYKRILGLTAKERDKDDDKEVLEENAPIIYRIPMEKCLEKGWVAPYTIYNLGLELPPVDRAKYDRMHNKFIKYFSTFDFNLGKMYKCLQNERFRERFAETIHWDSETVIIHAAQANRIMQKRKQFLQSHNLILEKTVEILEKFQDRRIITFSEVTSFADKLIKRVPNSVVYHSSINTQVREYLGEDEDGNDIWGDVIAEGRKVKNSKGNKVTRYFDDEDNKYTWKEIKKAFPDKDLRRFSGDRIRDESLKRFEDGEVDIIHTAKALNEGVDIHDVDMSVKSSFNSTTIDNLQRTGRISRKDENNKTKRAIEVNLYFKDTQSEKWLNKSQKHVSTAKEIESIEEIV